jgi:hypothetical protein
VLNASNPQVQAARIDGQVEGSPLANFWQKRTPAMDILFALVKDDDGIESHYVGAEVGSAYENDDFQPGTVFYNDEELGDVYYRINAYNDEVELKKTKLEDEKQLALVKNEEVKIVANNREIVFRSFRDDKGKIDDGYLSLLHEGNKYIIYKRVYKKFSEPKPAANSMVRPIPSRFTDYIAYYYQNVEDSEINEIPLKTNKFLKTFSQENTKEIKDFIKANNLDLANETHLIKVFSFIDTN